jgi:hypothetical protein
MSLLNLIVHPERAYLITDSGHFGAGGRITRLRPKIFPSPRLGLAIATTGILQCDHLAAGIVAHEHLSQANFVAALPGLVREAVERHGIDDGPMLCDLIVPDVAGPARQSIVAFAGYSKEEMRAFGGILVTHEQAGFSPYEILWKSVVLSPLPPSWREWHGVVLKTGFDPALDAQLLIQQQQRHNFGSADTPMCGIAGDIELTTVGADGLSVETIATLPGVIGAPAPRPATSSAPPYSG